MTAFFTSDQHFGHKNIIKYSNRPFSDVNEMNEMMVKYWNDTVGPDDTVYSLGDFAFCDAKKATEIIKRLNGIKHMVWGNHDSSIRRDAQFCGQWASHQDMKEISVEGQKIVLCHFAFRTWNGSHRGTWSLYGHSHGTLPDDPNALQLDVGVDCWDMKPASFDEVKKRMEKKEFMPIDHHGSNRE